MQQTGHIIVTNVTGTPLNGSADLQAPMIINKQHLGQQNYINNQIQAPMAVNYAAPS